MELTVTMTESETTVTGTFVVAAPILRDALATAVIATGKDNTLPVLTGVELAWSDGGEVTLAATDRYRLIVVHTGVNGAGSGRVLLPRADVEALVKALPKMPKRGGKIDASVIVALTDRGASIRCETAWGESLWSRDVRGIDGDFPKWTTLVPSDDQLDKADPIHGIGWNPDYMASFAKAPIVGNAMYWRFQGPDRPMVATVTSEDHPAMTATFLLMPVRQGSH